MNDEQDRGAEHPTTERFGRFRRASEVDVAALSVTFADALAVGDGDRAEGAARQARASGMTVDAICARIIAPSLYVVGDLWERGELSVADEHLATVITHRVLAVLHSTLRPPAHAVGARVLLATPAGQRHAIGLQMVADVLEGAGYEVIHLGADTPSQALRHAVTRHRPDVVGLSLTTADGEPGLEQAIAAVDAVRPQTLFLLGGQAAPARLAGDRIACAGDVEGVVADVERLLATGRGTLASARLAPPLLSVIRPPKATTADERLAREAAEIGEVAREHARLAARYRRLAFEDQLSGLPNRRAFDDRFLELARLHDPGGGRERPPLAVLLFDVDNLKLINDEHGHDAGDRALQQVGAALRASVREQDLAARLGGDEFGVLLPDIELDAALRVAARIQQALRGGSEQPPITISGGVARYDGDRRRTMIRADQALYEAKRRDRSTLSSAG